MLFVSATNGDLWAGLFTRVDREGFDANGHGSLSAGLAGRDMSDLIKFCPIFFFFVLCLPHWKNNSLVIFMPTKIRKLPSEKNISHGVYRVHAGKF